MPAMSAIESALCRSAPWNLFARRVILPWVLNGQALTGDVLEIGAGSGAMAEGIVHRFPDVRLTVTDVDDRMVAAARRRLAGHANVKVTQASTTALPFPDANFDAVASYLMLHHVASYRQALAEAARVLRPGGLFLGYDIADSPLARVTHRLTNSPHLLVSSDGLRGGLAGAGFRTSTVRESKVGHLMRFRAQGPR